MLKRCRILCFQALEFAKFNTEQILPCIGRGVNEYDVAVVVCRAKEGSEVISKKWCADWSRVQHDLLSV